MGKKYIIELEDNESVYKTIISNGYPMIQIIVPAPYTKPDLEQVREKAYRQGINDAREEKASCQFCEYETNDESSEPCISCFCSYMNRFKPKKEEVQEVQIGDEVIAAFGKAVVTGVGSVHLEYVYADGSHGFDKVGNVKKTGRHFLEIAEVLQKMKEEDS